MIPQRKPTAHARRPGPSRLAWLWLLVIGILAGSLNGGLNAGTQRLRVTANLLGSLNLARSAELCGTLTTRQTASRHPTGTLGQAPGFPSDGRTPAPERASFEEKEDSDESSRSRRPRPAGPLGPHRVAAKLGAIHATSYGQLALGRGQLQGQFTSVASAFEAAPTAALLHSQTILSVAPARGPPRA